MALAASTQLHATDAKGDTPLHIAARIGNLFLCDLFIRSGANPRARNFENRTPADAAHEEGHGLAARILSSLVSDQPDDGTIEPDEDTAGTHARQQAVASDNAIDVPQQGHYPDIDDLEAELLLEVEETAGQYYTASDAQGASGAFVPILKATSFALDESARPWEFDATPTQIIGEGIGIGDIVSLPDEADNIFLKTRNRGPSSKRRAIIARGTRLSIAGDDCKKWTEALMTNRSPCKEDIDDLISLCEGNGEQDDLRVNLLKTLENAGLEYHDSTSMLDQGLWDIRSHVSSHDLAEAVEAALTRRTRLPGIRRFVMDKSDELQLLEPMIRAKQELQLAILASNSALDIILNAMDEVQQTLRPASSISLRPILPAQPDHDETAEVFAAVEALKSWRKNGAVLDGKRRREALSALDALDLSMAFHKEIARYLLVTQSETGGRTQLEALVAQFEGATKHLVLEHLPYARRFASRNVEDGEDPEDVFQVAFIGLQQSIRRFDPERGSRFVVYCAFWMKQALNRWRADEGSAIRIPAHRHEKLVKLNMATDRLDVTIDGIISDTALAKELEWSESDVHQFRRFPRIPYYPDNDCEWDSLLTIFATDLPHEFPIEQYEKQKLVKEMLDELPDRDADVIRMRFGIDREDEMTLEEIGELYGVTRERIRQIEAKVLRHLSHPGRMRRLQTLLGN